MSGPEVWIRAGTRGVSISRHGIRVSRGWSRMWSLCFTGKPRLSRIFGEPDWMTQRYPEEDG